MNQWDSIWLDHLKFEYTSDQLIEVKTTILPQHTVGLEVLNQNA